ncbi:hypothetical protein Q5P01_005357 [Channa striata]|uniref:Uncharacterized protein n=1 Tax=Channa striata TaxID=64152 RepID=A0AA88NDM2_CHASR|nr:hypothetical protein Q5P01_005357 [Channa striata]
MLSALNYMQSQCPLQSEPPKTLSTALQKIPTECLQGSRLKTPETRGMAVNSAGKFRPHTLILATNRRL